MAKDTTIKKIDSSHSPKGDMGQTYLASGVSVAMRMWNKQKPGNDKPARTRPYETVGYVLKGKAKLHLGEQVAVLEKGDSWVVPRDTEHTYEILETFTAVEATHPPAHVDGRDDI